MSRLARGGGGFAATFLEQTKWYQGNCSFIASRPMIGDRTESEKMKPLERTVPSTQDGPGEGSQAGAQPYKEVEKGSMREIVLH